MLDEGDEDDVSKVGEVVDCRVVAGLKISVYLCAGKRSCISAITQSTIVCQVEY